MLRPEIEERYRNDMRFHNVVNYVFRLVGDLGYNWHDLHDIAEAVAYMSHNGNPKNFKSIDLDTGKPDAANLAATLSTIKRQIKIRKLKAQRK